MDVHAARRIVFDDKPVAVDVPSMMPFSVS